MERSRWTAGASARVLVMLLLVLSGSANAATKADRSAVYYEDALARFDAREYKAAIIQLKNALRENPKDLAARFLIARAYLKVDDGASAEKELNYARRNGADETNIVVPLANAYLLQGKYAKIFDEIRGGGRGPEIEAAILTVRGHAHLALRQFDEAEKAFAAATRLLPGDVAPILGQAKVQLGRGKFDDAEILADKAIARAPMEAEAWYLKGETRRLKRNPQAAVADYDKAIEIEPRSARARLARAGVLIDLGRHESAKPDILFVREKNPANLQAAYFLALVLAQAGDVKGAQAVLEESDRIIKHLDPAYVRKDPPTLLLAGVVSYFRKDFDAANEYLHRYVALVPYHAGARKLLGTLLTTRGDYAAAIRVLRPALGLVRDDPQLLAMMSSALMGDRQYSEATVMLEKAAELAPDKASIRSQLALTRLVAGQTDRAAEDLEQAFAGDPQATQAGALLSLVQLRRGEFEKALATAQSLAEKSPRNPFPHNVAGGARIGVGDVAGARASFERAVAIDPGYAPAQFNLARLDLRDGNRAAAAARYRTVLERHANNARAMFGLSAIAEAEDRLNDAIRWLEKARYADPDRVAGQIHLVDLHIAARNPETALLVAQELRGRAPRNLAVMEVLGRAQRATGRAANAVRTYNRMADTAADARSTKWLNRVARLQIQVDDLTGAEESLNKALEIDPKSLLVHVTMVEIATRNGKLDEALKLARRLRSFHPKSAVGDTLTGDVLMRMRRFAEAAEAYEAGLGKVKKSGLVLRLYRSRRAAGALNDALPPLETWVAEHPRDQAARRALAAGYMDAGRLEAAGALHEKLLEELPEDPALLNNLALIYQRTGDPRALPYAERAYKLAPEQAAVIDTLGWILVRHGDAARGLKLLRDAQIRTSKQEEVRYHLAVALNQLGRTVEARRELEQALGSGRNFNNAAEARALLRQLESN